MKRSYLKLKYIPILLLFIIALADAQNIEENGSMYEKTENYNLNPQSVAEDFSVKTNWERLPLIKEDFIVNTFDGKYGAKKSNSIIAIDGNGNYAVTWVDSRNGTEEIYVQFFNKNDEKVRNNILVSKGSRVSNIKCNSNGNFIIVWNKNSTSIVAQRFDKTGLKQGDIFQLNSSKIFLKTTPMVTINKNGYFLASWFQYDGSTRNIYTRFFNPNGNPLNTDIIVNESDKYVSSIGLNNYVAVDGESNFVVTWSTYYNNRSRIFLQRYDDYGNKIGKNIMVSDSVSNVDYYFPSIAGLNNGYYLIIWMEDGAIYGRIYHRDGYFVTDQFLIYKKDSYWILGRVSANYENNSFIVLIGGGVAYKCRQISANGEFLDEATTLLSNTADSLYGQMENISDMVDNQFYVTFIRDGINVQKFDSDYNPLGDLEHPNDDKYSSWQNKPLVYYNDKGNSIILWDDSRNGHVELYGQVYDSDYNPISGNINIIDSQTDLLYLSYKDVCSLSDGTFVVGFSCRDSYHNSSNIYLQKISSSGAKIESNKLIKKNYHDYNISIAANNKDEILVSWYNTEYFLDHAYLRNFNKKLEPISQEIEFIKQQSKFIRSPYVLNINNDLTIFVNWVNYDPNTNISGKKLYGLFYNNEGTALSDTLIIHTIRNHFTDYNSIENNSDSSFNYIVSWISGNRVNILRHYHIDNDASFYNNVMFTSGSLTSAKIIRFMNHKAYLYWTSAENVYGCYLNDNKENMKINLLYQFNTSYEYWNANYRANSADIYNDNLTFTYESNKNGGTGYDIWANVQELENIDFDDEVFRAPVKEDFLYQNFPNPFNSKSKIAYKIFSYHHVKIAIYDVLGREVKVLVDKPQEKGYYELEFDAASLPSGLYFCRLQAFNTKVIKMLLVK